MSVETYDFTPQALPARSDTVDEDTYLVKLVEIGEKRTFTSQYDNKEHTEQDFVFEIVGPEEFQGKKLAYSVNPLVNMGYLEGAKKSKLYKVLTALLGAGPESAGRFTSADLIGRTCKVVVENKISTTSGREYSRIVNLLVNKKQAAFAGSGHADELPIDKPSKTAPKVESSDDF